MLSKTVLFCAAFVLLLHCTSASSINIAEREKDIDLISEIIKLRQDQCASDPCQNGGICVATEINFKCICMAPYFGETCNDDPCASSPCLNGGKCKLDEKGFKCVCKSPFTGETCKLEPCSPNPCENDGECKLIGDSFNCTCKSPYHGDNCELGPCSLNPCKNGGECEDDGDSFKCTCKSPFTGDTCEQSPCTPNPCQNDGKCYITDQDDFTCLCKEPFSGERCEKGNTNEPDIFMSTSSDSIMTSSFTDITDIYNSKSSDSSIAPIDEESTSTDSNSTDDILSTTLEKGNRNAPPKGICETDSDCLNGGTCRNEGDKNSCDCAPNFAGLRCEVNLPCVGLEQSCRIINSVCVLVDNHAICECPNGTLYHRKSGLCEDICDARKCFHGKCEIIGRSYKCNCDEGYTGSHCDETEKAHHENFIPWFTVLASIGLFICVLLIAMFCVICQIKTFISS